MTQNPHLHHLFFLGEVTFLTRRAKALFLLGFGVLFAAAKAFLMAAITSDADIFFGSMVNACIWTSSAQAASSEHISDDISDAGRSPSLVRTSKTLVPSAAFV